jgi:hypothetical protein
MGTKEYLIYCYLKYLSAFKSDDGILRLLSDLENNSDKYSESFEDLVMYCHILQKEIQLETSVTIVPIEDVLRSLINQIRIEKIEEIIKDV